MFTPFYRWYFIVCLIFISHCISAQLDSTNVCSKACCFNDPTPAGLAIGHLHAKKEWMVSYRYMRTNMAGMTSGTRQVTNDLVFNNYLMSSSSMRMDMHMLMAMYGLSSRFTIMAMMNYSYHTMTMLMATGTNPMHHEGNMNMADAMEMRMQYAGLNDLKLHALFGIWERRLHALVVSGGISIPTGSIQAKGNETSMYPGQRVPYLMQLGSGTVDILPGLTWIFSKSDFSLSSQITAVLRTGSNKVGYKLGDEATGNTWVAYQWFNFLSSSLRAEYSMANRIKGYDKSLFTEYEPSASQLNYGNRRVLTYLGAKFYIHGIFPGTTTVAAEYGIPVYQFVNGIQLKTKSTINLSANLMF